MTKDIRCPGQSTQFWTPNDIFEIPCSNCGSSVEFFKDDALRVCERCQTRLRNPNLDEGCKKHCSFAESCTEDQLKEKS